MDIVTRYTPSLGKHSFQSRLSLVSQKLKSSRLETYLKQRDRAAPNDVCLKELTVTIIFCPTTVRCVKMIRGLILGIINNSYRKLSFAVYITKSNFILKIPDFIVFVQLLFSCVRICVFSLAQESEEYVI